MIERSYVIIFDVNDISSSAVATVIRHELGHGLGLGHALTYGDLMYREFNEETYISDDDYCFGVVLGNNNPFVLRGGSALEQTDHYTNIANPRVIGITAVSDENDHYSIIPHSSYEFRIPTDLVGRSDIYGFYLGVYDSHVKKIYAFPENLTSVSQFEIPSPSQWGEIVSPDKSLPEFPVPAVALLGALVTVIFITKKAYSFMNP